MGGDHAHWQDIQPAVAQHATTISYDRAGILWSDKSAEKSLDKMASDLEYLLEKTKCPKPYILVGHSFGGVTLRKFVHDNASDIAGIVFIDVSHPLQKERFSPELMKTQKVPPRWAMAFLNEIGVLRLLFTLKPFSTDVPRDHWFNENVHQYSHRIFPGVMREAASDDKLNKEALSYDDFGDIPLRIITATYPDGMDILTPELMEEYRNGHFANQKELLGLSTQSAQIWAKNSGHYVTLQEPELIITCIERLLRLEKSK